MNKKSIKYNRTEMLETENLKKYFIQGNPNTAGRFFPDGMKNYTPRKCYE